MPSDTTPDFRFLSSKTQSSSAHKPSKSFGATAATQLNVKLGTDGDIANSAEQLIQELIFQKKNVLYKLIIAYNYKRWRMSYLKCLH